MKPAGHLRIEELRLSPGQEWSNDEAAWRFLGLSLAGYNVLISLVLAAIAAYGLFAGKPGAEGAISRKTL